MDVLMTVLGVILLIAAIFLVIAVLMQSSKSHKLSGTIAGGAETFFGKSKGATIDKKLNTLTAVVAVIFVVLVAVMYIIQPTVDYTNNGGIVVEDTDSDAVDSDAIDDISDTDADDDSDAEIESNADDAVVDSDAEVESDADDAVVESDNTDVESDVVDDETVSE